MMLSRCVVAVSVESRTSLAESEHDRARARAPGMAWATAGAVERT